VRREHFLAAGGFSPDFKHWGGEDTELGWRLYGAGLFFVPVDRAAIYHQDQEESHPEGDWRDRGRDANAALIRSKIPHRFYRSSTDAGPFEVPKVSVVLAPGAGPRTGELLSQLHAQRLADWEVHFPLDVGFGADDPRIRPAADAAGSDEQRLLRAVAAARGEYVAVISGAAGLHPSSTSPRGPRWPPSAMPVWIRLPVMPPGASPPCRPSPWSVAGSGRRCCPPPPPSPRPGTR